jgi:Nucleoside 2-deoxyribosyltransferase like
MKVITCPDRAHSAEETTILAVWVFVAGGISNCPDWQKEMIARFKDVGDDLVMINPRRTSFKIEDPAESSFQIEWEREHLNTCDAIIFWFPFQTLCPITLFELGVAATQVRDVPIFVGCHPAYERKFDVEKQLSLITPSVKVRDNFEDVVNDVKAWYTNYVL